MPGNPIREQRQHPLKVRGFRKTMVGAGKQFQPFRAGESVEESLALVQGDVFIPVANTESDLAGYRIYVGTRSGSYGLAGPFEVTSGTSFTIPNLPVGTTYFFAVSAFDKTGNESAKSAEVSKSLF